MSSEFSSVFSYLGKISGNNSSEKVNRNIMPDVGWNVSGVQNLGFQNRTEKFWNNFLEYHPEQESFVTETKSNDLFIKKADEVFPEAILLGFLIAIISGKRGPEYYKEEYYFMNDDLLSDLEEFSPYFKITLENPSEIFSRGWKTLKSRWMFYLSFGLYCKILMTFISGLKLLVFLITFVLLLVMFNFVNRHISEIYEFCSTELKERARRFENSRKMR